MRIRLLKGRDFTDRDDENAPRVVVVNAAAARSFWPGENPIGKRVHEGDQQSTEPWRTVVGIVADVKQGEWKGAADPEIYFPFAQDASYRHNPMSFLTMTLVVRAKNGSGLAPALRDRIARIDRNISVPEIWRMEQVVRDVNWQPRTSMILFLFFSGLAVLLAVVGIYAVVSFIVTGRTQEIGVRMALGARRIDVVRMVIAQALRPVGAGILIGLAGAAAITRVMASMLYGVRPTDGFIFGAVAIGLTAVALAASAIPARRAATLDPLTALRHD
jgi:predicted permease